MSFSSGKKHRLTSMSKDIRNFRGWIPNILRPSKTKKADVVEHPKVFDHVGLLFNKPPGRAGLLFI
jgi:hypothetical protein